MIPISYLSAKDIEKVESFKEIGLVNYMTISRPDKTVPDKTIPDKTVRNCKIFQDKTVAVIIVQ